MADDSFLSALLRRYNIQPGNSDLASLLLGRAQANAAPAANMLQDAEQSAAARRWQFANWLGSYTFPSGYPAWMNRLLYPQEPDLNDIAKLAPQGWALGQRESANVEDRSGWPDYSYEVAKLKPLAPLPKSDQ